MAFLFVDASHSFIDIKVLNLHNERSIIIVFDHVLEDTIISLWFKFSNESKIFLE